jgi:hypothetical protein
LSVAVKVGEVIARLVVPAHGELNVGIMADSGGNGD